MAITNRLRAKLGIDALELFPFESAGVKYINTTPVNEETE